MFFEDEKDILKDDAEIEITDDGTVIWDDILDNSEDELVSISKKEQKAKDEIEFTGDFSESVDNDELMEILQDTEEGTNSNSDTITDYNDTIQDNSTLDEENYEEFDLDKQLENVETDLTDAEKDFKIPDKKPEKGGVNKALILVALLLGILFAGGVYYAFEYFNKQGVANGDLERNKTVEDTMNETTREDIERRSEEGGELSPEEEERRRHEEEMERRRQEEGGELSPEEEERRRAEENNQENIPVVNEDNANEMKAEKKEKKEVIDIVPTGRIDPFLPIPKYLKTEIPETVVRYDRANIIKPPATLGVENEATTKMLTISVSGIMYDIQKPSAIITFEDNDYFVQIGDKLDDYKVIDIGKNYVTVSLGKNIYKANIGEEFKLTDIYGNAKYLTDKYDGGRQYYSINKNNSADSSDGVKSIRQSNNNMYKPGQPGRYVSEKDVEINVR